ncbi:MAG TPA: glycosyltransferase family 4 protein [Acidobacteriaceae bacterium]|nr:glycosyltransferase family 4 protein [Acidobacteriaceae bacterium]
MPKVDAHSKSTFPTEDSPGRPDPRVISNSSMWQSERWNLAVKKVSAGDSFAGAIRLAWQLVRERRHYDAVYTVGVRQAQMYGLLCAIVGTGNKPHIAAEILLDEVQPNRLAWKIKRTFRRAVSRNIARMIVFSDGERELYSRELHLPLERVVFVPFHTNILESQLTSLGAYGFAAGRSLRDYETLFAAVENLDFPFVVVADSASVAHLCRPSNVELHCDIPRAQYLKLLEGARFVVVPLKADYRSTGQVVVLEAESFGKPVVASDVVGTRDYLSHDVNGLLVAPGNPEALRAAIQALMTDDAMCRRLAAAGIERVKKNHTFSVFAAKCLDIIAEA